MLLLLALLSFAACGDGDGASGPPPTPAAPVDGVLSMRAFEWGFEPEAIALRQGEEVRIVLRNEGEVLHDLKIEEALAADAIESRSAGPFDADEGELFVGVDAGEEGTLAFVPRQAGTFVFWCTIRGHRELGMEGTLTVESSM